MTNRKGGLRAMVADFARSHHICTDCFCNPAREGFVQCEVCYKRKLGKRRNQCVAAKKRYVKNKPKILKTMAKYRVRKRAEKQIEKSAKLHDIAKAVKNYEKLT